MTFDIVNALPVPRPDRADPLWRRVVELAGRLAAVDERFADWAKTLGVDCGPIGEPQRQDMLCELDAVVAHLYGLSEKHLQHIFQTFHEGWEPGSSADHPTLGDYTTRWQKTWEFYKQWEKSAGRRP